MSLKDQFLEKFPDAFFLERNVDQVNRYLQQQEFLHKNENIRSLEKPGEGNMNFVLRVITNQRSFILKQARPWVEKFPQIGAPIERVSVEAKFFQSLEDNTGLHNYSPKCLRFDDHNFILITEDLGKGADYNSIYKQDQLLGETDLASLIDYLSMLHETKIPTDFPDNLAMRKLNHEHIFNFPFLKENGFNLDEVQEGLQSVSILYKSNDKLKQEIEKCGVIYLSKGKHLIHGDFYPGSWLSVSDGIKVIDPEFGFVGPVEFDLAVLIAHLMMAEQPVHYIDKILQEYQQIIELDKGLLAQFSGIEILRRSIGIAQLPLALDLKTKKELMDRAAEWILQRKF